ncbi:MAG: hypothetical protein NZ924_06305 [Candidatus Bipolaricaulota bacterium]|nr:hypothetical protein [Candidatus Bipolaricaulota bacterium]MDW8152495.1 hypothetical protein [Candidatus Bipolaricaulota bacterium]
MAAPVLTGQCNKEKGQILAGPVALTGYPHKSTIRSYTPATLHAP